MFGHASKVNVQILKSFVMLASETPKELERIMETTLQKLFPDISDIQKDDADNLGRLIVSLANLDKTNKIFDDTIYLVTIKAIRSTFNVTLVP